MMQYCPSCNNQLPAKASFCAHCGQALASNNGPALQALDTPEPPATPEKGASQQALSTLPDTPRRDEEADAELPTDLTSTTSQDPLPLVETSDTHTEAQSLPPALVNPPSAPANDNAVATTLAFPAFEETSLPIHTPLEHTDTPDPVKQAQMPPPDDIAELEPAEDLIPQMPFPVDEPSLEHTDAPDPVEQTQMPLPSDIVELEQKEDLIPQMPFPVDESSLEHLETPEQTQMPLPSDIAELEPAEDLIPQMPFPVDESSLEHTDASDPVEQAQMPLPAEPPSLAEKEFPESEDFSEIARPLESASVEQEITPELEAQKQTPSPAEPAHAKEREISEPEAQTQTPSPAEPMHVESETQQQTPSPAEPAPIEPETQQQTPSSITPTPVEQIETIALQPSVLATPERGEQKETVESQESSKPPASAKTPRIEAEKAPTQPSSTPESASRNKTEVAEAKTLAGPSAPPKLTPRQQAELADQETLVVPAIPKSALVKRGSNESQNQALRETRKSPGSQSRTEGYAERSRMDYWEDQQNSNVLNRPHTPSSKLQPPKPAPKPVRTIGGLIWSLISPIFKRARDVEPERLAAPRPQASLLGWLPIFALSSAFGLFTVSTAFNAARANASGSELYYWLGIGLIYLPIVVRLVMPHASRAERVGLLCLATICLFLTKVSLSPLYYSGYDEFLHWRSINDILSTGHLLSSNPLLPVSPFYPGLEITTSALSAISGMTSIQAGFTVVGIACLIMILSLFLLAETLSGSARLASIAAIIYMANPHFLFFDTQFAYESLALPLATVVMLTMARYEAFNQQRRHWLMLVAWTVLLAMDLTHHATNFVFEGLFLLWAIVYLFLRPLPLHKSIVTRTTLVGIALTVGTVLVIGNTVIGYFTSFFADISSEVAKDLGSAGGTSRQLFGGAGTVIQTPLWERLISLGSVGLITLAIPFLLLCFWRRYRRNSLVWVFAIIVTFYPVLQVLRLTTSGAEISDRASSFIFIAISFLGAVAIVQFWPVRFLNWRHSAVISTAILVLFMGGIILGEGIPPTFMPGLYLASADARSVDPEGIQAALWAYSYLGPNQRMYTDRINQLLMGVYGDQYLVTKISSNIDATDVVFDPVVSKYEISLLQKGQIHYLAMDLRLSTQLPQDGFYYEQGEASTGPNGDNTAINSQRLTKFDIVPQINRLFDSGNIAIYDTGGLINAPPIS